MSKGEKQLAAWSGNFGNEYLRRNRVTPEAIDNRKKAFTEIFKISTLIPSSSQF